jgi:hypothetical protein
MPATCCSLHALQVPDALTVGTVFVLLGFLLLLTGRRGTSLFGAPPATPGDAAA